MRAAFDAMGPRPPGCGCAAATSIPHARGLGSSSAAIVGGHRAGPRAGRPAARAARRRRRLPARRRHGGPPRQRRARRVRRVGDLAAATTTAFYAVRAGRSADRRGRLRAARPGLDRDRPRAAPGDGPARGRGRQRRAGRAARRRARRRLPSSCCARTRDLLHQDYRRPAMPASLALVDALRADGVAAVVSGAGPDRAGVLCRPTPRRRAGARPTAGGHAGPARPRRRPRRLTPRRRSHPARRVISCGAPSSRRCPTGLRQGVLPNLFARAHGSRPCCRHLGPRRGLRPVATL